MSRLTDDLGYLPRSGKGITVAQAITGLKQGLNVGADFSSSIGGLATLSNANPLALTFNLGDLKGKKSMVIIPTETWLIIHNDF